MTTTTMTSAQRLANKKAVLRQRGVPEKFIEEIAKLATPDKAVMTIVIFAFATTLIGALGLLFLTVGYHRHVIAFIYGPRVSGADLFIAGPALSLVTMWLLISLVLLPTIIIVVGISTKRSKGAAGEASQFRTWAFQLCNAYGRPLSEIRNHPRWANLASLPSAQAFMARVAPPAPNDQADTISRAWVKFRLICIVGAAAWALITFGAFDLARNSYTSIENNTIEYKSFGEHVTLPLSQVSAVETSCTYTHTKRSSYAHANYFLSFQGHSVNLYDASAAVGGKTWSDTLDRLVAVDTALKAYGVPMHKLAPFDQLDGHDQGCLNEDGTGDGSNDARIRQLIFG